MEALIVILSIFLVEVSVSFSVTDDGKPRHPQHLSRGGEGLVFSHRRQRS